MTYGLTQGSAMILPSPNPKDSITSRRYWRVLYGEAVNNGSLIIGHVRL